MPSENVKGQAIKKKVYRIYLYDCIIVMQDPSLQFFEVLHLASSGKKDRRYSDYIDYIVARRTDVWYDVDSPHSGTPVLALREA